MEKEQNQKSENNTQIENKDDEVIDEASNEKPLKILMHCFTGSKKFACS